MSELIAAVIGALIGSATTILWETVLRPRRERVSVAAALNAEVAYIVLTVDRYLDQAERHMVPIDFRAPNTVYQSLSGRLGELPPDISFVLATLYSALDEANALPVHYRTVLESREGEAGQLARRDMERLTARFFKVLASAEASARLAHTGLCKMAPGVRIELSPRRQRVLEDPETSA